MRASDFIITEADAPAGSSMWNRVLTGLGLGSVDKKQSEYQFFAKSASKELDDVIKTLKTTYPQYNNDQLSQALSNWFSKKYGPVNPNYKNRFDAYLNTVVDMIDQDKTFPGPKYQQAKNAYTQILYNYQQDSANKLKAGQLAGEPVSQSQAQQAPAAQPQASPNITATMGGRPVSTAPSNLMPQQPKPGMSYRTQYGPAPAPKPAARQATDKDLGIGDKPPPRQATDNDLGIGVAAAPAATPAAKPKRTGGKVKGQLSTDPRAIARRQASAARRAQAAGLNVSYPNQQPAQPAATTTAKKPRRAKMARAVAKAAQPKQEPIRLGKEVIKPSDPRYAKIMRARQVPKPRIRPDTATGKYPPFSESTKEYQKLNQILEECINLLDKKG